MITRAKLTLLVSALLVSYHADVWGITLIQHHQSPIPDACAGVVTCSPVTGSDVVAIYYDGVACSGHGAGSTLIQASLDGVGPVATVHFDWRDDGTSTNDGPKFISGNGHYGIYQEGATLIGDITITHTDVADNGTGDQIPQHFSYLVAGCTLCPSGSSVSTVAIAAGAHGQSHTVTLKKNGTVVGTRTTGSNTSSAQSFTINLSDSSAHEGDVLSTYVDGVLAGTHTVHLTNIGTVEVPNCADTPYNQGITFPGGDYYSTPTPTPFTTPTPSGGGTPTPLEPGATPPPTVTFIPPGTPGAPGGGGVLSGHVTVDNPADIYKPIVDALREGDTFAPATEGLPAHDADNYDRGHLDDLEGQVNQVIDNKNNVVDTLTSTFNDAKAQAQSWAFHSFGTAITIPMNFSLLGHAPSRGQVELPTSIDLIPYSGVISVLREVLLWLLRIAFWVLTFRLFMSRGVQATV